MTDSTGTYDDMARGVDDLSVESLRAVVELQRAELNRLLREQTRLNDRIDSLLRLHEREQVLRQQMQVSLDRLAEAQIALSGSAGNTLPRNITSSRDGDMTSLQRRLERTEDRFSELQHAVGDLVAYIERQGTTSGSPTSSQTDGAFVRIYAPE
ncbi:MAG: hypothetical protein VW644_04505 [Alphaproteobacteria bacterium]|jgi:chromosome segregation ATPase